MIVQSLIVQSLADLGTHLGSTSEACLALAHSHDLINYITLEPQSLQQHWWVHMKMAKLYSELNSTISDRDQLLQKLLSAEHAGDWLLSIPCRQLGTLLPSTDFRFLLKFRLGISPLSAASTCNSCHREFSLDADLAGDNSLCCVKSGYVRRHYVLCNHLRYLLTTAGISTSSEVYVDQRKTLRIDLLATAFGEGVSEALGISLLHTA